MSNAGAESHYQRGNALRTAGRYAEAETALRDALRLDPAHRGATYSLAFMLREQGRVYAAAEAVAAWVERTELALDDTLATLGFLLECATLAPAQALARSALLRWPADARLAARAGEIALALGEFDEAATALRDALDRDPNLSAAWLRLAHCRRYTRSDDPDLQRFEHAWADSQLMPPARTSAGFALGKVLDDLGDYARAARVLRAANAQAQATAPWSRAAWRGEIEARLAASPPPALAAHSDFVPIFVVGLPRSGTTLIASTLGSFDGVRDRGELNWIAALHAHLHTHGQMHDTAALAQIAALIRAQMRRDDAPVRCYVDKNPLNFRYVDFILALFPNARIVHCRRGPRDTALSQWMQHFAGEDMGYSHEFADIALVARDEAALMAHWRMRGIDLLDIDYETFVADPAAQRARLAQFIGADNAVSSERATAAETIQTASVWQVRQPVHQRSIGRWRDYAPHLPELEALFAS